MDCRCKLIDDYLRGKIDESVCKIIDKLYDLLDLYISGYHKSTLYIIIGMIYQKKLTTKEEQEINNIINSIKDIYNNSAELNKEEKIDSEIENILKIIVPK